MTFSIRLALAAALAGWLLGAPAVLQAQDADNERTHLTNEQLRASFDKLAEDNGAYASVAALPEAAAGEYVVTLTRRTAAPVRKPALLIIGSLDSRELLPGEACLQIATQLLADEATKARLTDFAVFIIPVASHRSRAMAFGRPAHPVLGALTPIDNDHDGEADEDGPRDINGDGVISQMRIARAGGAYRVSTHDARLLVKVGNGEIGTHDLFVEGVDDDGDGRINEDPVGTVALTNDWAIGWDGAHAAAGRFPMMRPETRAIAEFLRQHPEIVMAVHLRSLGGALRVAAPPGKPGDEKYRRDRETAKTIDALYKKLVNEKPAKGGAPEPGPGSLETWLYESQGAITLTSHLFATPTPTREGGDGGEGEEKKTDDDDKPTDAEQAELDWLAYRPADFREWQSFVHPQLGDVEVGGWRIDARHDPTPGDADEAVTKHASLLGELLGRFPRIQVTRTEVESRGANLYRVRLTVHNAGKLDMRSDFAVTNHIGLVSPALFVNLHDTPDVTMITGTRKQKAGNVLAGATVRFEWVIRAQNSDSRLVFGLETGIAAPLRHVINLDKCAPLRTDD